jgi:hypothetical protein
MKYVLGAVCLSLVCAVAPAQTVFTVDMDGAQADGGMGTGSLHTGGGTVVLNAAEDEITVSLTHTIPAVDATVGHIHLGDVGVSGGIVFSFSSGDSPVDEVFAISPAEVAILQAEGYYVNIHTTAFSNGEIRGQIIPEPVMGEDTITSSIGGYIEEGDALTLTAPAGSGYQWHLDGMDLSDDAPRLTGTNAQALVFTSVLESDSGAYTVTYDDGTKAIVTSPAFALTVLPAGSLPAAGWIVMVMLAVAVAGMGVVMVRRWSSRAA